MSPREEVTDVLPSRPQQLSLFQGTKSEGLPTTEEGYPRLIARTSQLGFYGEAGNEPPAGAGPTGLPFRAKNTQIAAIIGSIGSAIRLRWAKPSMEDHNQQEGHNSPPGISWRFFAVSRELDMEPFVDADKSVIVSHFH